jgi:four helix bundle protein
LRKQKVTRKIKEDEFIFPFEKLEVWQLAVDLADYVLNLMESFPANKYFRLIGQMEAAVSSVAQNSAEGKGRQHKKEFIQFLYIAEGSLFEVLTLTEIFKRRKLINDLEAKEIRRQAEIIDRKLHGLINSLRGRL